MSLEFLEYFSIVLLIIGFVGHSIQMKRIRQFDIHQGTQSSFAVFFHKSNVKWYGIMSASIVLWALAFHL